MKKKTVITTEKREVWVIRQASGEVFEHERNDAEDVRSLTQMGPKCEEIADSKVSPDEES